MPAAFNSFYSIKPSSNRISAGNMANSVRIRHFCIFYSLIICVFNSHLNDWLLKQRLAL